MKNKNTDNGGEDVCETRYISDKIGEEYKEWKEFQIILINAPTGSGKSYFIFNELLNFAIIEHRRILYLVNRKILKDQLENEYLYNTDAFIKFQRIHNNPILNISSYVHIQTYQSIEKRLLNPYGTDYFHLWREYACYDYVIYDECHYFYSDSNFNTYTELSYTFLRNVFYNKIQIFISATMDNMLRPIKGFVPALLNRIDQIPNSLFALNDDDSLIRTNNKVKEYKIEANYDYIDVSVFDNLDSLITMIGDKNNTNKNGKWLIFTDSIPRGREIKKKIEEICSIGNNGIVLIDATYGKHEDSKKSVESIINRNITDRKIIISTSVMDNGISIKDKELRNLVLLCDTKEEFIQMLGRKRKDGEKLNVYLWKRDISHFSQRVKKLGSIIYFYQKNIKNILTCLLPVIDPLYPRIINPNEDISKQHKSQKILESIFESGSKLAGELFFPFQGCIYINYFSIQRCEDLFEFYNNMLESIKKDGNAFIEIQLRWLGKSQEDIEDISDSLHNQQGHIYINNIEGYFEDLLGHSQEIEISTEKYRKLKNDLRVPLEYFYSELNVEEDQKKTGIDTLKKADRTFSADNFNLVLESAELPYYIEERKGKGNSKSFCIKRK